MIYFYYGDEDFIISEKIKELKQSLGGTLSETNFKSLVNPDFADLISAIRVQGVLFGKILTVIEIYDYLKSTLDDKQIKQVTEALEANTDNADIIFTAKIPRDGGEKIDKRKKLFKLLSKYNSEECSAIPAYKTAELTNWIKKFTKEKGLKIQQNAIDCLISQVGNNLWLLNNELEKIKVYIYPNDTVEEAVIKEICVNNEDFFAFSDFIIQGQIDRALLEYKKLLLTNYPLIILAVLQKNVRQWILLKAKSTSMSEFELSKLLGMHEYRVKLMAQKLKKTELKKLVRLKENLTEAEYRIKAGLSQNIEDEVKYAFIR